MLLLPYLAMATALNDVPFTANLAEAQTRATRENKPYFVHFTATWCAPCRWMEENTFTDVELATYVHDNYLAVKIDFDDQQTESYKKRYNVTALPTVLIFNAKGELLDRYGTSMSKEELLQALQKNNPNPVRPQKIAVATKSAPVEAGTISRPPLIPEGAILVHQQPAIKPTTRASLPKSAEPIPTLQFSIQVGVYSDDANADRSRSRMEARFDQPVKIVESRQNDKKLYKVMVGNFENKVAAEAYLERLNAQGVKGFVKNIDN